jgi:hypothetical protein
VILAREETPMAERLAGRDQARLVIPDQKPARPTTAPPFSAAKIVRIATSGLPSAEAAKLLDTTATWVRQLARRGELAYLETPLGRLYDREDVLCLAEARRIAQAGRPRRGRRRKPQTPSDQGGEVIGTTAALPVQV